MYKYTKLIGIDISKDTFDYCFHAGSNGVLSNNKVGFKSFVKLIPEDTHVVMEATGSYHQQLAIYLHERNIMVSIVNPLAVKRFIQMKLKKNKTDKSDAKMIAWFGFEQAPVKWIPNQKYIDQCKDIQTTIGTYLKTQTTCKNKLHSQKHKGITSGPVVRSIKKVLKIIGREIEVLESEMEQLIKENEPEMFTNLTSIPGIGNKTAMLLISATNGFANFESHKQVCAYFGLAPQHYSSGTSVYAKSRITKTGNARVRNHLFMWSFTACEQNPQCKALYERIVNKGKSKKLALIAVCNKLIKQSYAIAKSGLKYDKEYKSRLVVN
jgi:transposase